MIYIPVLIFDLEGYLKGLTSWEQSRAEYLPTTSVDLTLESGVKITGEYHFVVSGDSND